MAYLEESRQLALDASVAVQVLMGSDPRDVEFIPLRPKAADTSMWAELAARWPGRGLRSIGVIGLVGIVPKVALKELLEPKQVSLLTTGFLAYLHELLSGSFAAQTEAAEIAELERVYLLPDTRPN